MSPTNNKLCRFISLCLFLSDQTFTPSPLLYFFTFPAVSAFSCLPPFLHLLHLLLPIPSDTPLRVSLSTFTLRPALSCAHFQQSNLISQREVRVLVEARALNRLDTPRILRGGPSHGLAVKSSRWLHKWEMAEVRCFQLLKYVL